MLWAVSSYHMHTHTHARLVVCLGFVTYPHHCCVTTVPPLLCCLIVSIHPRQSYLKPPRYLPPLPPVYQRVPTLEMFICTSLCCFSVPVLLVWVFLLSSLLLLTCRLVICRSAKLEFCTLPRTQRREKKKKREKREEVKTTQNYRLSDHRLIGTKLFINVIYPWWF